ncbi:EcsC family protein [Sediminibacillus massiliensis]|uniref:EcsC family protein n=1 Tax=Sediminibacillus massiliensis TaxID=1926277 RepID=UPI0009884FAC|nr:EcsC family protein [Sediminibacillus massiliensis]
MTDYEQQAWQEARRFERSMYKKSSILQRTSKKVQTQINNKIPDRIHAIVTESIKTMINLSLTTSEYIRPVEVEEDWTLEEREKRIRERLKQYKHTAMVEGAGTGAGGIILGLADFPLLLSIKMKFLFDVGQLYGWNVKKREERIFLLRVFLLAFSSDTKRREMIPSIRNWEEESDRWKEIDWKTLQQEYRDTIDFVKMLQLVPGFGAVVGAWANGKFLEQLGETAINAYRLRMLEGDRE